MIFAAFFMPILLLIFRFRRLRCFSLRHDFGVFTPTRFSALLLILPMMLRCYMIALRRLAIRRAIARR